MMMDIPRITRRNRKRSWNRTNNNNNNKQSRNCRNPLPQRLAQSNTKAITLNLLRKTRGQKSNEGMQGIFAGSSNRYKDMIRVIWALRTWKWVRRKSLKQHQEWWRHAKIIWESKLMINSMITREKRKNSDRNNCFSNRCKPSNNSSNYNHNNSKLKRCHRSRWSSTQHKSNNNNNNKNKNNNNNNCKRRNRVELFRKRCNSYRSTSSYNLRKNKS